MSDFKVDLLKAMTASGRVEGPVGAAIAAVREKFSEDELDDDQVVLHVLAEHILDERNRAKGKLASDYTGAEYAVAFAQAQRELGLVYRERPTRERAA